MTNTTQTTIRVAGLEIQRPASLDDIIDVDGIEPIVPTYSDDDLARIARIDAAAAHIYKLTACKRAAALMIAESLRDGIAKLRDGIALDNTVALKGTK